MLPYTVRQLETTSYPQWSYIQVLWTAVSRSVKRQLPAHALFMTKCPTRISSVLESWAMQMPCHGCRHPERGLHLLETFFQDLRSWDASSFPGLLLFSSCAWLSRTTLSCRRWCILPYCPSHHWRSSLLFLSMHRQIWTNVMILVVDVVTLLLIYGTEQVSCFFHWLLLLWQHFLYVCLC